MDEGSSKLCGTQRAAAGVLIGLLVLCFAIMTLGGFVRLSKSGMAIPEWPVFTKKITILADGSVQKEKSVLPPRTEEGWETLRQTFIKEVPSFDSGIALSAFKRMFFIEWSHRAAAFTVSLVLLTYVAMSTFSRTLRPKLMKLSLATAAVLAVQITLGGILVRLDLKAEALATHLVGAFIFTSMTLWALLRVLHPAAPKSERRGPNPIFPIAAMVYALTLCQIFSGGLMAGTEAGHMINTWPMMGDNLVPPGMIDSSRNFIANFTENVVMVQFFHRWFAFIAGIAMLYLVVRSLTVEVSRQARWFLRGLIAVVALQITLGIFTLKTGVQPHLALTHQAVGLVLLLTLLSIVYETKNHKVVAEEALAEADERKSAMGSIAQQGGRSHA
ncbi:COX15/CtaA family protein [soil metagenome]